MNKKISYGLLLLICFYCTEVYSAAHATAARLRHRESCCDRVCNTVLAGVAFFIIFMPVYEVSKPLPCLPPSTNMTQSCWSHAYRERNGLPVYKGHFCPISDGPLTAQDITNSHQAEQMAHYAPLRCITKVSCPEHCKKKC